MAVSCRDSKHSKPEDSQNHEAGQSRPESRLQELVVRVVAEVSIVFRTGNALVHVFRYIQAVQFILSVTRTYAQQPGRFRVEHFGRESPLHQPELQSIEIVCWIVLILLQYGKIRLEQFAKAVTHRRLQLQCNGQQRNERQRAKNPFPPASFWRRDFPQCYEENIYHPQPDHDLRRKKNEECYKDCQRHPFDHSRKWWQ